MALDVAFPFNTSSVGETDWRNMARQWAPSGIIKGVGGDMALTKVSTTVTIASGAAWVDGVYCSEANNTDLTVDANGIGVLRIDWTNNEASFVYRSGATTPQNTSTLYELALFKIVSSTMTDLRVPSYPSGTRRYVWTENASGQSVAVGAVHGMTARYVPVGAEAAYVTITATLEALAGSGAAAIFKPSIYINDGSVESKRTTLDALQYGSPTVVYAGTLTAMQSAKIQAVFVNDAASGVAIAGYNTTLTVAVGGDGALA